jgi:hypothetical protein
VRERFYSRTPANGTPEQKVDLRRKRFNRAVDWAENQQLIAIEEIGGVTYLRLVRPESDDEDGMMADGALLGMGRRRWHRRHRLPV